jgi:hypothetical protein
MVFLRLPANGRWVLNLIGANYPIEGIEPMNEDM